MLKHLASGGMADVMLGRSDGIEGFERHVVLKRIRPELARDQRFIRMFLDEARVAATLHHQNIVQVHDIGEAGGEYFIAMEYVHGEDVRKILSSASKQRTYVPLGYVIAIVSAAAAGLHYAHERRGSDKQPLNIVHRDVSPSNILVGYDGSVKVVDFGIATASMRQETRSGSLKGKLSYMSPEQCKGVVVDRRSDVYALGVVLYELATTTRMIRGESDYAVMEQIVHGKIPPPQTRRPALPKQLSEIIMRALATDRDQRYATAEELRVALDQFASNAGLTASSSAVAAYMRQQFGQRPEPWLDLGPQAGVSLDDLSASVEDSPSTNSWNEPPQPGASDHRRTSSVPRHSVPIGVVAAAAEAPPEPARTAPLPRGTSGVTPVPSALIPTDSRMGWESQPKVPASGFPVRKAAVIGGALVAGVAIWMVARSTTTPGAQVIAQPAAKPAPALTAPAPAAMPPPPPVSDVTAVATAAPPVDAGVPADAASVRRTRVAAAPPARTPPRPQVETPSPKPTRTASVTASAPARPEVAAPEPAVERPQALPPVPAPAPTPVQTPPPVVVTPPAPAPATGTSDAPQVVPPTALDANRIAGDKSIVPDELTMVAISRSGKDSLISTYKVCITADGTISTVTQLRSTGFTAYDTKIQNTIRKDWRYRPYMVNGKATPVCTAFKFVYSQK